MYRIKNKRTGEYVRRIRKVYGTEVYIVAYTEGGKPDEKALKWDAPSGARNRLYLLMGSRHADADDLIVVRTSE